MENHHYSWENPLFQWSFSIAMLVHQRVSWFFICTDPHILDWTVQDLSRKTSWAELDLLLNEEIIRLRGVLVDKILYMYMSIICIWYIYIYPCMILLRLLLFSFFMLAFYFTFFFPFDFAFSNLSLNLQPPISSCSRLQVFIKGFLSLPSGSLT